VGGNLAVVAGFQHLLGLAMALALYTTLIRRHAPRWAATVATAPLLLDAYQLQMEQTIMPDVTFEALITTGLTILLWHPRPGLWRVAAGALVLGLATDVRQIGELLIMLALPDRSTRRGRRDATLLATLYDTAARVQELADLTVRDLLN
jgi:4-amino-4-deoxy-L-arabinose transferase-like glycosyltransferase